MYRVVFRRGFWVGMVLGLSLLGLRSTSSLAYSLSSAVSTYCHDRGGPGAACGPCASLLLAQRNAPEDRGRYERQLQKWQSLPPEEKKNLRRKMHQWKQMSPESRMLYQQRFEQWQNLPPTERDQLRQQLEHWEQLSPNEREEIRRKFLKP